MTILETERLSIRKLEAELDADFMRRLLNSPKFIKYIGDRKVRSIDEAQHFIRDRYRKTYEVHGYGLYVVELKADGKGEQIGICGFVRRDSLPAPDLGFAFLPEYEGKGFGFESANALLKFGRETLKFNEVLAITTVDNEASGRLLTKLGFAFEKQTETSEGEILNRYKIVLTIS